MYSSNAFCQIVIHVKVEDLKKNAIQWPLMIGRDAWFHRMYSAPSVPREAYYKTKMILASDHQHNGDTVPFCVFPPLAHWQSTSPLWKAIRFLVCGHIVNHIAIYIRFSHTLQMGKLIRDPFQLLFLWLPWVRWAILPWRLLFISQ